MTEAGFVLLLFILWRIGLLKRFSVRNENPCTCPSDFPVCVCGKKSKGRVITRKPILPGEQEMEENPRSKSAKLRIFERVY